MNIWSNTVMTDKGRALMAKLTQGNTLNITKAIAGAGFVTPGLLSKQIEVTNPKQSLSFKTVSYPETGKCAMPVALNNKGLTDGYEVTQIGLFAEDPDEGEILFFISQAANEGRGTSIPSETEMAGYAAEWTFYLAYGQADGVNVTVDPTNTITQATMEAYVRSTFAPIEKDIADLKNKPYGMLSNDNVNFYVDGIKGSDNNDGLTPSKAFKTFDRFCEELNRNAERRCVFIGDCAEYEMVTVETFNNVAIHLINESNVSNITIHFKGRYTPAFYNSHLNVGGTEDKYFTLDIPNNLYFDGGAHVCAYTRFTNGKLGANGANLQVNYCEFINANLRGTGAKLHVRGCKFTYNGDHLIAADSGTTLYVMTSFTGTGTISDTDGNNYCGAICGTGARIVLGCVMTKNNLVGRTLYLQDSQVQCTDARFASWNTDSNLVNSVRLGSEPITYGTTDLTAGESALDTGKLYLVYE